MENADNSNHKSKRTLRRNSNSHISMSDTESTTSQADSWHSPLRYESPLRSDDPYFQHENNKSLVSVDKYYSPVPSPGKSNFPASSTAAGGKGWRPWPHSEKPTSELPAKGGGRENRDFPARGAASPVVLGMNRMVKEEAVPAVKKVEAVGGGLEEGYGGGDEVVGERRSSAVVAERSAVVNRAALVFRVLEAIVCLISFSVMAADKTQGWSGDSFDRYMEYRYCLAVNVIGFVYSAFQAFDLAYYLGTEKHFISHHLRCHFDFSMDQATSSSAATRVNDWILNWGKDNFTLMATASIAMSFLAFVVFALSSLISGYNLYKRD
ncbi:hypothetical protein BUALT_Bualt07G0034600 [Buddleja alternifolia]|uniref:CASP-like protein n=1 Tax=Buddleja alternifolia TaxID=168488 RepID=A0AAV6X8S6_9LAMI|nr:hypothetical protein BUALT_Bualt07G0034600 [Buddleja alternifolia]